MTLPKKSFLWFVFYPLSLTRRKILCIQRKIFHNYNKTHSKQTSDKRFYSIFGRHINYDNPVDVNEKIHWLKFYSDTSEWPRLADKYRVREYVASKGLGHILNELYAIYETADAIDISKLPDSFVMKVNNGSGDALIVKDKALYTNKKIRKYFRKFKEYGVISGEWHYLQIKPCIIAEKLLAEENQTSDFLTDYKFYCFNGEPLYVLVCYGRTKTSVILDDYTIDWKRLPEVSVQTSRHLKGSRTIERPKSYNKMIDICKKLGEGLPFVRIDFYEINASPVFSEMTLTPAAGFIKHYTQDFLNELGSHIQLPPKLSGTK
jgi:hypothetical protein